MAVNMKTKDGIVVTPEVVAMTDSVPLSTILAAIKKSAGDKIVIAGSDVQIVERIPTGMFEFDLSTGGGFPRGRYSIIYGPEGSTKTNTCYDAVAQAQKMPPPCNVVVWVDLEGTFDPKWAAMCGVDVDKLLVVKPSFGEQAVDMIDALIRADEVIMLVVDSLAVMIASKEIQQSAEKFDVGTSSLLIKRLCNKVVVALAQEEKRGHTPAVVFVNQTRFKIGVMFGDPETMPGGMAMKFLAALIIRIYGKNVIVKEVNPDLAAFKDVSAVIKKAKVPVTKLAFEYSMCVYPHNGLSAGQTRSWNSVSADLKSLNKLVKVSNGWSLLGKMAPTLTGLQELYESDVGFAINCQKTILNSYKGSMFYVEGEKQV